MTVIISLIRLPTSIIPFSLLNAFADGKFGSYWFGSGTPPYFLIKMLEKFGVEPSEVGGKTAAVEDFDAPAETMSSITPLLYQSGLYHHQGLR